MNQDLEKIAFRLLARASRAGACKGQLTPATKAYTLGRYDLVLATARGNRSWLYAAQIELPQEFEAGPAIIWNKWHPWVPGMPMVLECRWSIALHPVTKQPCRHGVLRSWYQNSTRLLAVGNYRWGQKEGVWRSFDGAGRLYSVERYRDGEWHGKQEYYMPDGRPAVVTVYEKGVRLSYEEHIAYRSEEKK